VPSFSCPLYPEYRVGLPDKFVFESGGRRVLCVHGEAWDRFLTDHPVLSNVADWFYLRMQRMSRRMAVSAKRGSKTFLRCAERVREQATEYGRAKGADVVICGHTHHAETPLGLNPATPAYFNTGCWTDHHCHYLTVKDGVVRLEEVDAERASPADLPASRQPLTEMACPAGPDEGESHADPMKER
jgi:UDP-2,3-diacylglucosamine pyrophosphatase LpxH